MLIAMFYYLKIPFCMFFVFSLLIPSNEAIDVNEETRKPSTSSTIYRKILKMRTLPFEDCGSTYDILFLSISSCNTIPCEMKRGSKVLVNVIFDDNGKNTSFLRHEVTWIFNAIKTYATISPDPCDGDHECLISSSDGKSYYATVFVNNSLPCIRGTMLWEAVDERHKSVICFRIPIVITS